VPYTAGPILAATVVAVVDFQRIVVEDGEFGRRRTATVVGMEDREQPPVVVDPGD
jgi:hypothetical protein